MVVTLVLFLQSYVLIKTMVTLTLFFH